MNDGLLLAAAIPAVRHRHVLACLCISFLAVCLCAPTTTLTWFPPPDLGLSHYLQFVAMLYYKTGGQQSFRKIVIAPTTSFHYPDIKRISLCDYFRFPAHISCSSAATSKSLLYNKTFTPPCVLVSFPSYEKTLNLTKLMSRWPPKTVRTTFDKINWRNIACLGETQNVYWTGSWHGERGDDNIRLPWSFQDRYVRLVRDAKREVLPRDTNYTVAHWRRGDQLTKRCSSHIDTSVNCAKTASTFIAQLNALRTKFGVRNIPIYVATNEKGASNLHALADAGFKLHGSVRQVLVKANATSTVDGFLLDLGLMCEARVLIQWGYSTSHVLTSLCRDRDPKKLTIVDGKKTST